MPDSIEQRGPMPSLEEEEWGGRGRAMDDAEEQAALFAALDSY
jgi:hypothetical protein